MTSKSCRETLRYFRKIGRKQLISWGSGYPMHGVISEQRNSCSEAAIRIPADFHPHRSLPCTRGAPRCMKMLLLLVRLAMDEGRILCDALELEPQSDLVVATHPRLLPTLSSRARGTDCFLFDGLHSKPNRGARKWLKA